MDTIVLGKGPAGMAAAAELAERGLRVGLLGPGGAPHWPAEYGAWAFELRGLGRADLAEHAWAETRIGLGARGERTLPHGYARVDKGRLAGELAARCDAASVRSIDGQAVRARHDPRGTVLRCEDGREVRAALVVDATGHRGALVARGHGPRPGFQTALGLTFEGSHPSFPEGQAVLMDWSDDHLDREVRRALPYPTFLYAMPLGDGRLFAEETVLVGRTPVSFDALEARLRRRLAAHGVEVGRLHAREECLIPMGGPLPDLSQRVVGFGGAAAMVHPATGYMLVRTLGAAPALAAAVAEALGAPSGDPDRAARAGWAALWPADRRRRRALFRFGMEVLLTLDAAGMQRFFDHFFALPDPLWQGYLADSLPTPHLAAVMARLFATAPLAMRTALLRAGAGPAGLRLASGLLHTLVAPRAR